MYVDRSGKPRTKTKCLTLNVVASFQVARQCSVKGNVTKIKDGVIESPVEMKQGISFDAPMMAS